MKNVRVDDEAYAELMKWAGSEQAEQGVRVSVNFIIRKLLGLDKDD